MRFANREKLKTLLTKNSLLVDMRSPVIFRDDPIKGAINLPLNVLPNKLLLEKIKDRSVILFGVDENDLKLGVRYSENLGFTNVYVTDLRQLKDDKPKVKR